MKAATKTVDPWEGQLAEPHWYVVRSCRAQERLALASIEALNGTAAAGVARVEAYLPMVAKQNRKGETYAVPLFPSFLFARFTLGATGSTRIFTARGVAAILGNGKHPSPLADVVIHTIKDREHDGFVALGLVKNHSFGKEEAVRVRVEMKGGAVRWLDAVFVERVDERRAVILLRLLTESPKLMRATVSLAHLRRASADAIEG